MALSIRIRFGFIGVALVALSGCVSDSRYAGGDIYDRYYGRSSGYRSVPYGYAGSGFGWYGDSYYPGTGSYSYDRKGKRGQMSDDQRSYWQGHARPPGSPGAGHGNKGHGNNGRGPR